MINEYINKDFGPIIEYCHSAQVFQDFPFACKETYNNSLINFHSRKFGKGKVPTKEDLMNATYSRGKIKHQISQ
jgi:hypothetical protein